MAVVLNVAWKEGGRERWKGEVEGRGGEGWEEVGRGGGGIGGRREKFTFNYSLTGLLCPHMLLCYKLFLKLCQHNSPMPSSLIGH